MLPPPHSRSVFRLRALASLAWVSVILCPVSGAQAIDNDPYELRSSTRRPGLSILDIAPILLYSLGLDVPQEMEGKLPPQLFEPGWLSRRPLRYDLAGQPGKEEPVMEQIDGAIYTKEDERILMERLRALGYIE